MKPCPMIPILIMVFSAFYPLKGGIVARAYNRVSVTP